MGCDKPKGGKDRLDSAAGVTRRGRERVERIVKAKIKEQLPYPDQPREES